MVALYERLWLSGVDDDDNESEMILALLRITPQQWICLAEWHFLYLPTYDKSNFFFKFIDISFFAQIYVVVILHKLLNLKCFKFNKISDLIFFQTWRLVRDHHSSPHLDDQSKTFQRTSHVRCLEVCQVRIFHARSLQSAQQVSLVLQTTWS